MLHTTKQYPSADITAFHVFGRVMSGTGIGLQNNNLTIVLMKESTLTLELVFSAVLVQF